IGRLVVAESIYPPLPGLHDYYLKLNNQYPVLYDGVPELPDYLSPAKALTDTERQAVELLFESLVRLPYSPATGERYEPILAVDLPRLVPLGRQFQLIRNAYWSNGQPVTATDVRHTVKLLSDRKWSGRSAGWADLMEESAHTGGDAFQIS